MKNDSTIRKPPRTAAIVAMHRLLRDAGCIPYAYAKRLHCTHACGGEVTLPRSCPANIIARREVIREVMSAIKAAKRSRA